MSYPALDLGTQLRMARHRCGKSLRDVAATTKIPTASLEAIERNDFNSLPGGIFRRAYVRAFAAEVGIDPEPLPETLVERPDVVARVESTPGPWRQRVPTLVAIVLLVAAILLLQRIEDGRSTGQPTVAPAPSASLDLHFVGPSWISASADGERVVHRIVPAGERLTIEARRLIAVEIGDAGAVEASINGEPARLLGAAGDVWRRELGQTEVSSHPRTE